MCYWKSAFKHKNNDNFQHFHVLSNVYLIKNVTVLFTLMFTFDDRYVVQFDSLLFGSFS